MRSWSPARFSSLAVSSNASDLSSGIFPMLEARSFHAFLIRFGTTRNDCDGIYFSYSGGSSPRYRAAIISIEPVSLLF